MKVALITVYKKKNGMENDWCLVLKKITSGFTDLICIADAEFEENLTHF